MKIVKNIPGNLLIEKVQKELIRAIDFSSMELANQDNDLAIIAYQKTKKDVVEYKRVKPIDALTNKSVILFVLKHNNEVFKEFYGNFDDLKDYISYCQESIKK